MIALWCVLSVFVAVAVWQPSRDANEEADGRRSFYVRLNDQNDGVIIFVHGVLGDGISTWTNPNTSAYWPDLLTKDNMFGSYNVYVYEFFSPRSEKSFSIDEVIDNMHLVLENADVLRHKELIFLVHSMGGLVTRGFLLKYRGIEQQVSFIHFFSTPTTGSRWASFATLLSKNPQFHNMLPMGDNTYIESLQSSWLAAQFKVRSFCAYETKETDGMNIVTRQSATNLCTEPLTGVLADHISIVKPADQASVSYIAFRNAFAATHKVPGNTAR